MSLRKETPCDFGPCPYDAAYSYTCDYFCSEPEPEDYCDCDYTEEVSEMRFLRDNEPFSFDEDPAIFETVVNQMDDGIREGLHRDLAPCTMDEFMTAYCQNDLDIIDFLAHEFGITLE